MEKTLKRLLILLFSLLFVLTLAGCSSDSASSGQSRRDREEEEEEEEEDEEEDEVEEEAAAEPDPEEQEAELSEEEEEHEVILHPEIVAEKRNYHEPLEGAETYTELLTARTVMPLLNGESIAAYPELASALKRDAEKTFAEREKEIAQETEDAKLTYEEMSEYFTDPFSDISDLVVLRSDDRVVSFFFPGFSFLGGAHGMYYNGCATYDTLTGEKLTFDDVLKGSPDLTPIILEELEETYPDMEFLFEPEEALGGYDISLSELVEGTDGGDASYPYVWGLTPVGAYIYFDAYALNSYAEGDQLILLSYEEYPELFEEEYLPPEEESFMLDIGLGSCLFDVDGDGKKDQITIQPHFYEEDFDMITSYEVKVNDNTVTLPDIWCYYDGHHTCYLINKGGDRWYLYLKCASDSDILIYMYVDITGGKPVYLDKGAFAESYVTLNEEGDYGELMPADPEAIRIDSIFNSLGTFSAGKTYHPGKDGVPEPNEELYEVLRSATPEPVNILQSFSCSIVDWDGNVETENETIPEGETYELLRTDGETFVDVLLGDGRIARIFYTVEYHQYYVDGVPVEELFEGIQYAG